jgi:Uma2 family endonuclease
MMAMNQHIRLPARMGFEEFAAFVDTRPDEEKWELLEGHAVMSPTPIAPHQRVVKNLTVFFAFLEREAPRPWLVLPGLSVRVAELPASVPQPDVLIVPNDGNEQWYSDGPLAVFEVLSPGTRRRDLGIKCDIYRRMPTIQDYLVIAPKKREVTQFCRAQDWEPVRYVAKGDVIPLASVGLDLPLSAIYHDMAV